MQGHMWERCTFKPWIYWLAARLTLKPMGRLHNRDCPKPSFWLLENKMKAKLLVCGMFWWTRGVCGPTARSTRRGYGNVARLDCEIADLMSFFETVYTSSVRDLRKEENISLD